MRSTYPSLFATCAIALLSACSTPPVVPPAVAPAPVKAAAAPAAPAPVAAPAVAVLPAYLDPNSPLYRNRSVYFDFDNYSVKPAFNAMLAEHGKFLAAHPGVQIKVEGNTDERGSSEYNLALGQKRAEAVLKALKVYGVQEQQMEAVSYGKEKPKASGKDEASMAQNRRVDLGYPAK